MNMLNLSENILRLRRERKMTQEELADFAGLRRRRFLNGRVEVPLVKDTIPQLTLTRYCRKQLLDKYKEALSTSPLKMATVLLYFFGTRISNRQSRFVCPRDRKTRGNPKGGQRPSLAHGLCLQSLVCYTLYLRVCEKLGTGILVAGFEADKKSFVSVPVSVTEVKLFDQQVEGIIILL